MLRHTESCFVVKNVSNHTVNIGHYGNLKAGERVNLFDKFNTFTETGLLEGLRAPNGFLYKEIEIRKSLIVEECRLNIYDNVVVDHTHLKCLSEGKPGQVLGLAEGGGFVWLNRHDITDLAGTVDRIVAVQPPLFKRDGIIALPKASPNTNGYLSKEDWLFFRGKAKGVRIWQYQDFENIESNRIELTKFENGTPSLFNPEYIIGGSAVIVNDSGVAPRSNDGVWSRIKGLNKSKVLEHTAAAIVLDKIPSEKSRVYFLVILPEEFEIPEGYTPPPQYVKDARVELLDAADIGNSTDSVIRGNKRFAHNVSIAQDLNVAGQLEVAEKIQTKFVQLLDSPVAGYVLSTDAVGNGSWQPSPMVDTAPPRNVYAGQTWVKVPEYELFLYDGLRNKWVSVSTISCVGGKNSTYCSDTYLDTISNITMDFNSFILPWDGVLIGMTASCQTSSNWAAEVFVDGNLKTEAVLPVVSSDKSYNSNYNVDFNAGDKVQIYLNGNGISCPRVELIFKRRA